MYFKNKDEFLHFKKFLDGVIEIYEIYNRADRLKDIYKLYKGVKRYENKSKR